MPLIGLILSVILTAQDRRLEPIQIARRLALVVGNSNYVSAPLRNPVRDADTLSGALKSLDFKVSIRRDLGGTEFENAVESFSRVLRAGDLALFYFAGHGAQVDGSNYLIPVDFRGTSESDLQHRAISAAWVKSKLEESGARVRILIFDACRDNPYRFKRSGSNRGLGHMSLTAEGTLIAFATTENGVVDDNAREENGLYVKYLARVLQQPGLSHREVFEQVKEQVYSASGRQQRPGYYDEIVGRVCITGGCIVAGSGVAPADSTPSAEITFWNSIKDSKDAADFRAYKRRYPRGEFVELADARIQRYSNSGSQASPIAQVAPTKPGPSAKELERQAKRRADALKREQQVIRESNLTGCDTATVWLDPAVAGSPGGWNAALRITIINNSEVSLTIRRNEGNRAGDLVRNLCAGGKIDFVRRHLSLADPNQIRGILMASPTNSARDGTWVDTFEYSLYGGNTSPEVRLWTIRKK